MEFNFTAILQASCPPLKIHSLLCRGVIKLQSFLQDNRPYSWINENGQVEGFFKDVLEVVCAHLNLTLVMKGTQDENQNIWHKRYKYRHKSIISG